MLNPREVLLYTAIIHKGDWDEMFAALHQKKDLPDPDLVKRTVKDYKGKAVTIFDDLYPDRLRNAIRPPLVLFYEGDIELLKEDWRILSFTGSHDSNSDYAERKTAEIAKGVTKEGAIVASGLSRSCQSIALDSALSVGRCIGVLANGIDQNYPIESSELQSKIAKKGLLLSPFPNGVKPSVDGIRTRNLLIGQLGRFLFVSVAKKHDGVLLTMASAVNVGCDAGCLPFPAQSEFINNNLIRNGAAIIENAQDLLFESGLKHAQ